MQNRTLEDELIRCKKWIKAALKYSGGTHTYEDVADNIRSGKQQLWPAEKSCAVTEIIVYPRKKTLHIFLAGGDMEELHEMQKSAEVWAKHYGCEALTMTGRKGWAKANRKAGWKEKLVLMEKVIK